MKTAVIYARYSSNSQTEQSIEGQLHVCEEYAKTNGILILDTYIDRAMTGTNDMRPDFQRMLQDSAKREWDYVLVYKLDRFSRDKYATAIHKKTLTDNGVKVVSAMENIPDSPEGIILESLLEGMNQYYSAELSQKIRRGQNENRKKGLFCGGQVGFGYRVEDKKLYVVEKEAEAVRYIYAQYAIGVYVSKIIENLTAQGILYHGKPFTTNAVYNILRNAKYIGVYYHKGERYDNIYPQILSTEVFEAVRQKIEANKRGSRSVQTVYLLRHKARCGYCGRPIAAECGTSHTGKKKHYYKCRGRKVERNNCHQTPIRKETLESIVLDSIMDELNKPETMDGLVRGIMKQQERMLRENPMLSILEKEKKQIETALTNIMSAIEQGIMSQTTNKRLHELEARQAELERELLIERSKTTISLNEIEIKSFYEKALRLEAQALIGTLIKEVVVYNDKIDIFFHTPTRTSPDENRGFFFFEKRKTIKGTNQREDRHILLRMYT